MLIIHPKDRTTAMLSALYNEMAEARLMDCTLSAKAIEHELHRTPHTERIMLLGHGCEKGLNSTTTTSFICWTWRYK